MTETTTTAHVRNTYAYIGQGFAPGARKSKEQAFEEFDTWLADHESKVLNDAADAIQAMHPGEVKASVVFLRERAAPDETTREVTVTRISATGHRVESFRIDHIESGKTIGSVHRSDHDKWWAAFALAGPWVAMADMRAAINHLINHKDDPAKLELDPQPWAYGLFGDTENPAREATQVTGGFVFYPRPQYEQDRGAYPR